jgi:hypothetical protein
MAYCEQIDLENIYGNININRWADADGRGINNSDRITWAMTFATNYVDSRLANGPYDVPFSSPYPQMIVDITALYAGILLHDTRQISVSSDDKSEIQRQRRDFERFIHQILRGQMRLLDSSGDQLDLNAKAYPEVVDTDDVDDDYSAAEISL